MRFSFASRLRVAVFATPLAALAGCAAYAPLPLPEKPALAASLDGLRHDGLELRAPLTLADITLLVLQNNPDLRAVRAQHGLAQAQLLQAGLPPNPQLTGAFLPLAAGVGTSSAWNAGLSQDIKSLVTLSTRRRSARDAASQVDAQILWQEWQTVGQARLLAVDLIGGEQSRRLLAQARDLLAARSARSQHALSAGDATIAAVAPDLAAVQAAQTQLDDVERQQLSHRHQLNALLGLRPDAAVPLTDTPDLPPIDAAAVERSLPGLADRRPDLIALQLGYTAQDAKYRAAILAQFPNLSIGLIGGSDNSNVRNFGPQISLELPVFDRNQGNIAIERATRQQLHDEYAARLTAADGQVRAMLSEIAQLSRQIETARRGLASAERFADQGNAAFDAGNLDERGYVDLVSARLIKEQEIVSLKQSLMEQQVAIATLIGAGMPPVSLPDTNLAMHAGGRS